MKRINPLKITLYSLIIFALFLPALIGYSKAIDSPIVRFLTVDYHQPKKVPENPTPVKKPLPENIRSIYLTAQSFSEPSSKWEDQLLKSGGNALVVDIEHPSGRLAFRPKNSFLRSINEGSDLLTDLPEKIKNLQEKGVYVIARQVVFKDAFLSYHRPEWKIKKKRGGVFDQDWLDPSRAGVQNYNLYLTRELAEMGFDEIQLDYIRFPAISHEYFDYYYNEDQFSRSEVINDFLSKARRVVDYYGVKLSGDVFGVIVWGDIDWRIVGQDPKTIPDYLDAIYPMTYPSHFSPGFQGYQDPWGKPYSIMFDSIDQFVKHANGRAQIRPWIQGFPLKIPRFGTWFIKEQIKASYEAGAVGFAIWSPGNVYDRSWPTLNMKFEDYPLKSNIKN